jgi:hypothetical protein
MDHHALADSGVPVLMHGGNALKQVSPITGDVHEHYSSHRRSSACRTALLGKGAAQSRWRSVGRKVRRSHEYTAHLVAKRPDRFGHFATVPLPDVDGALSELEYALDTLRADGVILLGNYAEKYLGESLTAEEQTAISHGNAWTLFSRLTPQPHTTPSAPDI